MSNTSSLKSLSRATVRRPSASVKISWSDISVEETNITPSATPPINRADIHNQIVVGLGVLKNWAFCETDAPSESIARLDAMYAMPDVVQGTRYSGSFLVGWWGDGSNISDATGVFNNPPHIRIEMYPIPFGSFGLKGYAPLDEYPVDFDLVLTYGNGQTYTHQVRGNTDLEHNGVLPQVIKNVYRLDLYILRWSKRGAFVKITAFPAIYSNLYLTDEIKSLSVLEETEGAMGTLPIGNISSNELTLALQNLDDKYFFGNTASLLSNSIRANRRIQPSLGFDKELMPKGVYWSQDWTVNDSGTTADTTALDRLGLLQDVQYNGLGNINNLDADAELSYWTNKDLYVIATEILTDLRNTYMQDLEFAIDESLKLTVIPLAFFKSQSYFDIIKAIAAASCCFAYMDTPTDDERRIAIERGNVRCDDILRIRPLEAFTTTGVNTSITETVTMNDFITKTSAAKKADVVNVVTVNYTEYSIVDGKPKEVDDSKKSHTVQSSSSILEFGKIAYDYGENPLIQTVEHASNIANRILDAFSKTPYISEISMFGDVTRRIGDLLDVPEYQKHGISTRGLYAITRIQTEYDGGLRQSVICRKVDDNRENFIIDEMVDTPETIIDERNSEDQIDEKGGTI